MTEIASERPWEPSPIRPRLRGWFHQVAFVLSVPQGIALLSAAAGWAARVAAAVYALSLFALYGVSAAYHRLKWSPRMLLWMRRLDHSMIFLLIAGTYTPFAVLVLGGVWAVAILGIVWAGAIAGIALKLSRIEKFARFTGGMYIALGWVVIVALPQLVRGLSPTAIALLFSGGILYTLGALVLALRKPNPSPKWFGYHEVWHAMVVMASICHYAAVMIVVTGL